MIWRRALPFLALVAGDASAQLRPQPGLGDPRIQTVSYQANQVVLIEGVPGYQTTIELAPNEQIQSVAIGDSSAWQASIGKGGNRLYITPGTTGASTNMMVVTDARTYRFELTTLNDNMGIAPFEVRFRYPEQPGWRDPHQPQDSVIGRTVGFYHLRGNRLLRPRTMSDDGARTSIDWPPDVALPAIFVIDEHGHELVANGNMRDGLYVIDNVYAHLIFRIDRYIARADRYLSQNPQP